jgi:dihydrofolate reductase
MKHPRKIIVHIATSADGFIARPDGDVAWLDRPRPKGNYGYSAFFKSIDTILWGYKTYAKGLDMGMEKGMKAAGFGPQIKNYVFSRHPRAHLSTVLSTLVFCVHHGCVRGDLTFLAPFNF